MKASQANRARIAERTVSRNRPIGNPSTDLRARVQTVTVPYGYAGVRRHGNKASMTKAQRSGNAGSPNLWSASPYYWTNPTWSA